MATLTPVIAALTGVDPEPYVAAAAGGDVFPGQGNAFLVHVKNGDASAHDVVVDDPTSDSPTGASAFDSDVTVAVPAGGERMMFIGDPGRFRNDVGDISLSYPTGVTSVTLQIVRL